MSIVHAQSIVKRFGSVTVLDEVSLEIADGEVVAIIGRSGSGKSTLLRCLNGLEPIQAGTIQVAGHRVEQTSAALRSLRQDVGMIFQSFNLFPHMSALENVALPQVVVKRASKDAAREAARVLLDRVGLTHRADAYPSALSGGQQQRVAIARALALNPKILLCDEITSALDPEMVGEVLDVVQDLAVKGMTMLLVTHEMRFARRAANRIVFMHAGKIHEQGSPERIFNNPETLELKQFIKSVGVDGV